MRVPSLSFRSALLFCFAFAIIAVIAQSAGAAVECAIGDNPRDTEVIYCDSLDWDPVSTSVFANIPYFNTVFTVYTEWDYTISEDGKWGVAELQEFARAIFTNANGNPDIAHEVLDYFSHNSETAPLISIESMVMGQQVFTENFGIYIWGQNETITATIDCVSLHIGTAENPEWLEDATDYPYDLLTSNGLYLSPARVAREGFAHEWQHVCHHYYKRVDASEVVFGPNTHDFNEFCSKFSEHRFGLGRLITTYDMIYGTSITSEQNDYYADCSCFDLGGGGICLGQSDWRYRQYALLGAYLDNLFPPVGGKDFVKLWLEKSKVKGGHTTYQHSFESLSELLVEHTEFDPLFSGTIPFGTGADGRFRELFHRLAVAKLYNLQGSVSGYEPDRMHQWIEGCFDASNINQCTAAKLYGYLNYWDKCWYNNIHSLPIYHEAAATQQSITGLVEGCDYWTVECAAQAHPDSACHDGDWSNQALPYSTKTVHIAPYSPNYLVFLPSPGNDGTLEVSINFRDVYECIEPDPINGSNVVITPTEDLGKYSLYCRAIGYSGLPAGSTPHPTELPLHTLDADTYATLIDDERYFDHMGVYDTISFAFPGFSEANYDAIVVVVSVVDFTPPEGALEQEVIPYEYSYQLLPSNLPVISGQLPDGENWSAGSTVWIDGSVEIPSGSTFTINEGVRVNLMSESVVFENNGTLIVNGTSSNPVIFDIQSAPGQAVERWAGLVSGTSSITAVNYAEFYHMDVIDVEQNCSLFSINNSLLVMARDGTAGNRIIGRYPQSPGTVSIDNSRILYLDQMSVAQIDLDGCSITQNSFVDPSSTPVINLLQGPCTILSSDVYYYQAGIQASGNAFGSSSAHTIEATAIEPIDDIPPAGTIAIKTLLDGHITATDIIITKSEVGISAQGTRGIVLRESEILIPGNGTGVEIHRNAHVDLGTNPDPEPPWDDVNYIWAGIGGFLNECNGSWQGDPAECIVSASPPVAIRVLNRSVNTVYARSTFWAKSCICPDEFFLGAPLVLDQPFIYYNACCPPGGGMYLGSTDDANQRPIGLTTYPTPFNSRLIVELHIGGDPMNYSLEIVDISGRRVASLASGLGTGTLSLVWDGIDSKGTAQASGVYFVRANVGAENYIKKCLLIK